MRLKFAEVAARAVLHAIKKFWVYGMGRDRITAPFSMGTGFYGLLPDCRDICRRP